MNAATPVVGAAQAIGEWQAERRSSAGVLRDLLVASGSRSGTGAASAGALPRDARVLDTPLGALLEALHADPEGNRLRDQAVLAGQRGMVLRAVVLDTAPGEPTRLAIDTARVALPLPDALRAGETVFLRLVAGSKADTFLLSGQAGPAAGVSEPLVASPAADLGNAARLISHLLESGQASRPISSALPLTETPGSAAGLATGLQDAIRSSGLFYESHLADWVAGTGSKAELMREPQAAFLVNNDPSAESPGLQRQLAPQAEALVQRQLDLLENNEAVWKGQVWPGQEVELHIEPETPHQAAGDGRSWQAAVRLAFPGLGSIEAQIGLRGKSTTLRLRAAEPHTAQELRVRRSEYARALGVQGMILSDASVSHAGRD